MRTTRALAVSATALLTLGLAAPTATARDGFHHPSNIVAMPSVIAPGGQLTVTVNGCPKGGHMTSDAFPRTELRPIHHSSDTAKGVATVHRDARRGPHHITVDCDGKTLTKDNAFTVIGGAQGGIGGSSSSGATPTDMAIGGGLMGLALVGGAVFWMRRRSENQA
ncbi:hypothetical protein [Streptomyces sp. NBC_00286]|uniref:hypothetical protein n=1 Tax=Streptomyces sp. NBC_00286 TaxID=2975701 RepID=UPI002E28CF62|nr:hypothetical protein [Streptomyces sp. NBC_00286]